MTPHHGKFISYLRVSTKRQGHSGLGLEAQRAAVTAYLNGGRWQLVEERVEVESGKDDKNRPALTKALEACKLYRARATLVIAKLDPLSRDAYFLLDLEKAKVEFVAVDMPNANKLTVGIMAMVAEQEREAISQRTKAALQAAKARGVRLGQPKGYRMPAATHATRLKGAAANRNNADAFCRTPASGVRQADHPLGQFHRRRTQSSRHRHRSRWPVVGRFGDQPPQATGAVT